MYQPIFFHSKQWQTVIVFVIFFVISSDLLHCTQIPIILECRPTETKLLIVFLLHAASLKTTRFASIHSDLIVQTASKRTNVQLQ